jgi:hypothetical protein
MRTTIDIEDDVLNAAKELARQQHVSAGQLISRLLREAFTGNRGEQVSANAQQKIVAGFQPFASQGVLITNAQIDSLRDIEGV